MANFAKMILWITPIAATALNAPAFGADMLADSQLAGNWAGAIGSGNGNGNGNIGNNNGNGNSGNNNGNGNVGSNNGNGNATDNNGNGGASDNNGNRAGGANTTRNFLPPAAFITGFAPGASFPVHAGHAGGIGTRIDPPSGFSVNGDHGFRPR
jgi:hypothetical protein